MIDWRALVDYVIDSKINGVPLDEVERLSLVAFFDAAKLNCSSSFWVGEVASCASANLSQIPINSSSLIEQPLGSNAMFCLSRVSLLGKCYNDLNLSTLVDSCFLFLAESEFQSALSALLSILAIESQSTTSRLSPVEARATKQAVAFLRIVFKTTSYGAADTELSWIRNIGW